MTERTRNIIVFLIVMCGCLVILTHGHMILTKDEPETVKQEIQASATSVSAVEVADKPYYNITLEDVKKLPDDTLSDLETDEGIYVFTYKVQNLSDTHTVLVDNQYIRTYFAGALLDYDFLESSLAGVDSTRVVLYPNTMEGSSTVFDVMYRINKNWDFVEVESEFWVLLEEEGKQMLDKRTFKIDKPFEGSTEINEVVID